MKRISFRLIAAIAILLFSLPFAVYAADGDPGAKDGNAERTVMMYICGSDLESQGGMATHNLHQVLNSRFSDDEDVRFIVMTGGSSQWQLESEYLKIDTDLLADDEKDKAGNGVSCNYNQIWEAKGADYPVAEDAKKLILLDGDGITGDAPVLSENELMTDPDTLKTFINYCTDHYPAEKYDLILWDHGGGPTGGYGFDENCYDDNAMSLPQIVDAMSNNNVTGDGGKFDFVDFDTCLMNSVELNLLLSDYTDCYIASAEYEPGYGQDYSGWVSTLGGNPEINGYTLGRQMVDDFYAFYTTGKGKRQHGTLAAINMKELMSSECGFVSALSDLNDVLHDQAGRGLFYDELRSYKNAIGYGKRDFYDVGNLAALLSVVNMEIPENGDFDTKNAYSEAKISEKICGILENEDIVYARGNDDIVTKGQIYRTSGGEVKIGNLYTSGMYIFFPSCTDNRSVFRYCDRMSEAIEKLPVKTDGRYQFLKDYRETVIEYALITQMGFAVSEMLEYGGAKDEIDYAKIREYWTDGEADDSAQFSRTKWGMSVKPLFDRRAGGESEETKSWLDGIVKQQALEAVCRNNISAKKLKEKSGTGYRIYINGTKDRAVDTVKRAVTAELPVAIEYLSAVYGEEMAQYFGSLSLGYHKGILEMPDYLLNNSNPQDHIRWYNETRSAWNLHAGEQKWYAVKDASGAMHVAPIYREDSAYYKVLGIIGQGDDRQIVTLEFEKGSDEKRLTAVVFETETESRPIAAENLTEELSVIPAMELRYGRTRDYVPVSKSPVTVSAETAGNISLVYTDIKKIGDDFTGVDGELVKLKNQFLVTDLYYNEIDVTDIVESATEEVVHLDFAAVKNMTYTGKPLSPQVTYEGKTLREGIDYNWDFYDVPAGSKAPVLKNAGSYKLVLMGLGDYMGFAVKTVTVNKAANPLNIKARTASVKRSKLKKKAQTLKISKVITFKNKGQGTKSYKFVSAKKGKKSFKKYFKVNKKNGKVTVKKGLKKGTYKVKIKVKAAGNANYKASAEKTVTFKIRIK